MKLITEALEKRFAEIGNQSKEDNPLIIAKFFNVYGSQIIYVTEYDPKTNSCYGYVTGKKLNKWDYFFISELELLQFVQFPFEIAIERDIYFKEIRFNDLKK